MSDLGLPRDLAPASGVATPPRWSRALAFALDEGRDSLPLATLLALVPILGWMALRGWSLEVERRLLMRAPGAVPRLVLRDLGHYLREGSRPLLGELGRSAAVLFVASAVMALLVLGSVVAVALGAGAGWLALVALAFPAGLAMGALGFGRGAAGSLSRHLPAPPTQHLARRVRRRAALVWLLGLPLPALVLGAGFAACGVGALPVSALLVLALAHLRVQVIDHVARETREALPSIDLPRLPSGQ